MWDLRDPSIHHTRLVCGTIFSHKGQGLAVDFASFILIVSKVTLCNLTMADYITLTHKSQTNICPITISINLRHVNFIHNFIGNENLEKRIMWSCGY